uniref:Uncharacterized protein n=1 Tax=Fundulus heteroclitus TaxID=8078 RepID=A0A146QCY0_FUNHE
MTSVVTGGLLKARCIACALLLGGCGGLVLASIAEPNARTLLVVVAVSLAPSLFALSYSLDQNRTRPNTLTLLSLLVQSLVLIYLPSLTTNLWVSGVCAFITCRFITQRKLDLIIPGQLPRTPSPTSVLMLTLNSTVLTTLSVYCLNRHTTNLAYLLATTALKSTITVPALLTQTLVSHLLLAYKLPRLTRDHDLIQCLRNIHTPFDQLIALNELKLRCAGQPTNRESVWAVHPFSWFIELTTLLMYTLREKN